MTAALAPWYGSQVPLGPLYDTVAACHNRLGVSMNTRKPARTASKKLTLNRATIKRLRIGDPNLQPPAPGTANTPQCPNPNIE